MIHEATSIFGVYTIHFKPHSDERGFFHRTFCRKTLKDWGEDFDVAQSNLSFNEKSGTLRGMHFQSIPHEEKKIVQCIRGAIFDVVVDLRSQSPSYQKWYGVQLDEHSPKALLIPGGCAHGFLTLEDKSVVYYQMSKEYKPEAATGVRWNDPAFKIKWPSLPSIISKKDQSYPDWKP